MTHQDIQNNPQYLNLLSAISKLSGLFSDNAIPYINYRVVENIFCRSFNATNLSRSDTAFDAQIGSLGIGLKTFTCPSGSSTEKVAEFNSLAPELKKYKEEDLALKLAEFRNRRIDLAKRTYGIEQSIYHIVARKNNELIFFNTDYDKIDETGIKDIKSNTTSLQFKDKYNSYSFNHSKSTLFRKFDIPDNAFRLPIEIIQDPYALLLELVNNKDLVPASNTLVRGIDYIILPLFSTRDLNNKEVGENSGLNAWHAKPRPNQVRRPYGEMYIPIPKEIHKQFPDFLPPKEQPFNLKIPTGQVFSAKVCQGGPNGKALMTNPNSALEQWLLRDLLQLAEGQLATMERLNELGFDCMIVYKDDAQNFRIDKAQLVGYEEFIEG